jgi:hypothetical protein
MNTNQQNDNDEEVDEMCAELLSVIAPCGLDCEKCLVFEQGEVRRHASKIIELLGSNFDGYAERFTEMNPVFKNYPGFKALLDFLSQGSCGGCRKEGCLLKACRVHTCCVKEKGVDFCFECAEFPCDRHGLPAGLREIWEKSNIQMKDQGIETFYEDLKQRPRYP